MNLKAFESYAAARSGFVWPQPSHYNIAVEACDAWADRDPERTALIIADERGRPLHVSYAAVRARANRAANALAALDVVRGDRVAIQLGQSLDTLLMHLAVYKLGAVAVPLAAVFGPDAISYRIAHSGAKLLVTTRETAEGLPPLAARVVAIESGPGSLHAMMEKASAAFRTAPTGPDDPALMIYTSGTTGQPKGALHGHRVLLGHLPGVQMHHDLMPHPGDRLWTPADWAWAGGLLNVLLPGLAMGVAVVAQRTPRFDAQESLDWAAEAGARNAFVPPTALRLMRDVSPPAALRLRSMGSGGEQLGAKTFEWARERLGVTVNEFYGQSECNLVLSSCAAWGISHPGVIGRPVPGHDVAVIDGKGHPAPDGTPGTVAVRAPDPVMFLRYHDDAAATEAKFVGDWMTTGDQAVATADGVRFIGRDDDIITSAGYRIGPGEVEDCLAGHPAVSLSAVVGRPDEVRGEVVTAYVKLSPGVTADQATAEALQAHVRERLSAHEYPREVIFVDDIPLTTTGKVIRRAFRDAPS